MEIIKYILIGFIQGLTETIPVSSSGHIMLIKYLLQVNTNFDSIALMTNFGSLLAIIIIFYNDFINIIKGSFNYLKNKKEKYKYDFKYFILIIIGCIPALICGLIVKKLNLFSKIENNIKILGISWIITSVLLFIIRKYKGFKEDKDITIKDALFIGSFQILGLFPGISRSASTISGSLISDLKRDTAFKYSFMLYIIISLAASIFELFNQDLNELLSFNYIIAIFISFIVTLIVTKWFRKIVNTGKLIYFSIYCFIIGLLVILFL